MVKDQNSGAMGVTPEMIKSAMDTDFVAALDETFAEHDAVQGSVVKGIVVDIDGEAATVDIGMKAEGRVDLREFADLSTGEVELSVGDEVDVYLENLDDRKGRAVLSREKARREVALDTLEKAYEAEEKVSGVIFGRVKGGFTVDLQGVLAFLPGSQVDVRPIRDMDPLMNTPLDFQILKMDRARSNLIVSRRAVMDESRSEAREELLEDMEQGKVLEGVVKNITDYGAFIDLGGVDGLLHITDIAWHRINHPNEVLSLGQVLKVQVIRFDEENKRVSLGLKQLNEDPWEKVEETYAVGSKVKGVITNITEYGAFVELAPGIEGLIHVSEMSWTRKNVHPGKLVSTSQEVEVMVLEIDTNKRRISLGLKQCQDNPWEAFAKAHTEGDTVKGTIRSITDFGIFLGLTEDIDGLIHMSDLSWDKSGEEALRDYKKGDELEAKILALDPEKERVALGVKQLSGDPLAEFFDSHKKGQTVKATVKAVTSGGIEVEVADGVETFIKSRDLSAVREEQDASRFAEGDKVEAKIVQLSSRDRKVGLSIKALTIAEEKEAIKAYANDDGGSASLGDVLGEALKGGKGDDDAKEEKKASTKKAASKTTAKKATTKKAAAKKTADKADEKAEDKDA